MSTNPILFQPNIGSNNPLSSSLGLGGGGINSLLGSSGGGNNPLSSLGLGSSGAPLLGGSFTPDSFNLGGNNLFNTTTPNNVNSGNSLAAILPFIMQLFMMLFTSLLQQPKAPTGLTPLPATPPGATPPAKPTVSPTPVTDLEKKIAELEKKVADKNNNNNTNNETTPKFTDAQINNAVNYAENDYALATGLEITKDNRIGIKDIDEALNNSDIPSNIKKVLQDIRANIGSMEQNSSSTVSLSDIKAFYNQ